MRHNASRHRNSDRLKMGAVTGKGAAPEERQRRTFLKENKKMASEQTAKACERRGGLLAERHLGKRGVQEQLMGTLGHQITCQQCLTCAVRSMGKSTIIWLPECKRG